MTIGPTDSVRMPAARALSGEAVRLVVGMTFAAPELFAAAYPGDPADPAVSLASAARALELDFVFMSGAEPWAAAAVADLTRSGVAVFWVVEGPLTAAARAHGLHEAMRLSIADPDALRPAMDEGVSAAASSLTRGLEAGISALVVAEDLAGASGPLFAPDFVHEELMPRIDSLVRAARSQGRQTILHSDGDMRVFVPALARARIAAVHGGGPNEGTFIELLREARRFGLRVVGGIGSAALGEGLDAAAQSGVNAARLALAGDVLVADDGGISSSGELSAFGHALRAARGTDT